MRIWGFVLTTMLAVCIAHAAAPAQDDVMALPMSREAFWEAKAAAGGVLDEELARMATAMTVEHMHWLQLSIERYLVDQRGVSYPQHINQLLIGEMATAEPGIYANPFTSDAAEHRDAVEVPFGWSEMHPGNFSYIQIYDEAGNVTGYILIGYGPTRESGQDMDGDGQPDGVVISLASSVRPFPNGLASFISDGRPVTIDMGE
jgi:hypothetical protein